MQRSLSGFKIGRHHVSVHSNDHQALVDVVQVSIACVVHRCVQMDRAPDIPIAGLGSAPRQGTLPV